jgi:hypothetical protein
MAEQGPETAVSDGSADFAKQKADKVQNRYGFSRRGADGKNQIGLSAGPETVVLEEFWRHFQWGRSI